VLEQPDNLSKFCTTEMAVTILSSRALRWSSPHLFGDPFELDHRTSLSFDPHMLLKEVISQTIAMIFSPTPPQGNSALVNGIRRWRADERFATPGEAESNSALIELLSKRVDLCQKDIDKLMADWRYFTRHLRICCFSEKPHNTNSWQRYADNHRGAVIRFNARQVCRHLQEDDPAHRVIYRNQRPEITTLKEQLHGAIHQPLADLQTHFVDKLLCKSTVARNEQEWRYFYQTSDETSSKSNNDEDWFDDRPFDNDAVTGIYLGAFMSVDDKKRLLELRNLYYPQVQVFQAQAAHDKYDIEFKRL